MGMNLNRSMVVMIIWLAATTACGLPTTAVGCPGVSSPVASGPGAYDGGDGYSTTQKGPLGSGVSCSSTIADISSADNWTFEGKADQSVTIDVKAQGDADPNLTVIDPNGDVIDSDDDSGGGTSPLLTTTLPEDGVYTFRIDMFTEGGYTISAK
jgi:Bacterial pre-peptidase C-terminal domain